MKSPMPAPETSAQRHARLKLVRRECITLGRKLGLHVYVTRSGCVITKDRQGLTLATCGWEDMLRTLRSFGRNLAAKVHDA